MTRGIQLKQLKTADLTAIGVSGDHLPDEPTGESQGAAGKNLLAQADPVLSRVLCDLIEGLEGTLQVLNEALAHRSGRRRPD